jgi:hypothetical protein
MAFRQDIDTERGMDDLDSILHNQGVADLSWLAVDEETYRRFEALPKQNFDMIPELQHALLQEPKDTVPSVIPLRPHTIVNPKSSTSPMGVIDSQTPIRNRTASYVMSGMDLKNIKKKLELEFSPQDLRQNVAAIKEVLAERGVLGNVYINASHFPKCAQGGDHIKSAKSHGKRALFVLAKSDCQGCVCNNNGNCSSFKKRIVSSVPYDERVVGHYAAQLQMEGRQVERVGDVKGRLQHAFLQPARQLRGESVQTIRHQEKPKKVEVTRDQIQSYINRQSAEKPQPLPGRAYIGYARRMMAGFDDTKVLATSTDPELRSLVKEYGLLGHTYLDMDAIGGCRKTLAFIENRKISPDFLVRREATCGICQDAKDGACAQLCKRHVMVPSIDSFRNSEDLGRQMFAMALERAVIQKRVSHAQAANVSSNIRSNMNWVRLTSQMNLAQPPPEEEKVYTRTAYSFHHGHSGSHTASKTMDPNEIQRSVSHMMNSGLKGRRLVAAIKSRYTKSDLIQAPEIGKFASENDGVQGFYFIDPTVYPDYGKSCSRGASAFRNKSIPYIKIGSKCVGCNYQLAPGKCSKYAKELIREVPREVVAHYKTKSLPVIQEVQNPVEEFELANDNLAFQVARKKSNSFDISVESSELPDSL